MNYLIHLSIYFSIYVIVALSLNMVVGYCGFLTLAHAGYFAIGSYTYALVTLRLGWGVVPAIVLAAGLAALLSLAVSLPTWRLKGDFFVMASLSVQALIFSGMYNWATPNTEPGTWANLTNGPAGLPGIPRPAILGIKFDTLGSMALLSLTVAAVIAFLAFLLLHSPWGRVLQAMRDDELAARGLGKNVRLLKVQVFAVACSFAAVGGVIYASYVGYIDPSVAALDQSILMLCMVIVGGVGNFKGPLVGAAVLLAIPEALRFAALPEFLAAELRLMAYGLLLVVLMHLRPQGLAGEYRLH